MEVEFSNVDLTMVPSSEISFILTHAKMILKAHLKYDLILWKWLELPKNFYVRFMEVEFSTVD